MAGAAYACRPGGDSAFVIGTLRLPRLVLAMLAGAGLSVAGAILQGVIRNPLASPDVLGMTGEHRSLPLPLLLSSEGSSAFAGYRLPPCSVLLSCLV